MKNENQLKKEILTNLKKYNCYKYNEVIDYIEDYENDIYLITGLGIGEYYKLNLKKYL